MQSYVVSDRTNDLITKAFNLHKPNEEQVTRLDIIRAGAMDYAYKLATLCPESAELTLALRALHQASQHAVTSVLFNEPR